MRQLLHGHDTETSGARVSFAPPLGEIEAGAADAGAVSWENRPTPSVDGSVSLGGLSNISVNMGSDADSSGGLRALGSDSGPALQREHEQQMADGAQLGGKRLRVEQLQRAEYADGEPCFFMQSGLPHIALLSAAEAESASQAFNQHVAAKAEELAGGAAAAGRFQFAV